MANIIRVKINWTGFAGGPGYTNLYFEPTAGGAINSAVVNDAVDKTDSWLATFQFNLPNTVTTQVANVVDELDENTGNIQSFWTAVPAAAVVGSSTGPYSAATGACVNWYTNDVWNGRRVRGRSFIVPMGSSGLASNGSFDDAQLARWRTDTDSFIGDGTDARLTVWKRPTPAGLGIDGAAFNVTSYSINDKVAVLTSRRD